MVTMIKENNVSAFATHSEILLQNSVAIGLNELHFKADPQTGLYAIVGIHNTQLGPTLGGCRCLPYDNINAAIIDAIRLAQGMSYKSAITGLPHGGGKAVLIRPAHIADREAYFEAFGEFLNTLGGRYITAVDSGVTPEDMDVIARRTTYVTCKSKTISGFPGDPSPLTALGVTRGIQAAVYFKLGKSTLSGLHIAIQGVGNVGYALAKQLNDLGARLTVADINEMATTRCTKEFGAHVVNYADIASIPCDVFAPCALGSVINETSLEGLQTTIIAGSANNQLATPLLGKHLHERGILYAPDYVINAGGLIHAVAQYNHLALEQTYQKIDAIYNTSLLIFERSLSSHIPTSEIADMIAQEKLSQ